MSGIAGIVDLSGERPVTEEELRRMAAPLAHRGPDDEGVFVSPSKTAGLAFRRLAVTDREHGGQPMTGEGGRVTLVHDGVIYNAPDLRKVLVSRNHRFRSRSDSEVILHLYEDHGAECVSALRGSFALACWDESARTLWLARDRLGKKPLYVAQTPGRLYFASEPRALRVHPEVSTRLDLDALCLYLTLGYVPAPRTIYQGISKLEAAHALVASEGTVRMSRYWETGMAGEGAGDMEDWGERVFNEMFEAVKLRTLADVPVGVLLSGGIGSSIVAGLLNLANPGSVKTFSLAFEGEDAPELEYARAASKHYATEHHEAKVKPDPVDLLGVMARQHDEPFGDPAAVAAHCLARLAKEHVAVALSGDGVDEVFLGHPRYQALEPPTKEESAAVGKKIADRILSASRLKRKTTRLLQRVTDEPLERNLAWSVPFPKEDRAAYFGDALKARKIEPWEALEPHYRKSPWPGGPGAAAYVDLLSSLPECVMARVDAAAMAHGLDVRCPFLDHLVVETAVSIPPTVRLQGRQTKALLRYAFMSLVPEKVLEREKAGYAAPVAKWLRGPLRDLAHDALYDPKGLSITWLKGAGLEKLIDSHASGKEDHGAKLWALLMLEMWHRAQAEAR